jgi:hypothetical protein
MEKLCKRNTPRLNGRRPALVTAGNAVVATLMIVLVALLFTACPNPTNDDDADNKAPTDILLSSVNVAEAAAAGTTVGTLSAVDEDEGDTHTFTLVADFGDNASFAIDGATLKTAAVLDFETKASYSIKIEVSDGTDTFTKEFTITVTDAAPFDGVYGGMFTVDTSTTNTAGSSTAVWIMTIDRATKTFETLGAAGLFTPPAGEATFDLDEATGEFSYSVSVTDPDTITVSITGTFSADGTVTGSGAFDYGSDGTVEETVSLSGEKHTTGHVVRGTVTFPFQWHPDQEQFLGTKYWVALDTDHDGGNGQTAAYQGVASGSNNACFIMLNVPPGEYYAYGVLSTSGDDLSGGVKSGDYSGGTAGTVTVSDNTGFHDFFATPDYSAMFELAGTWHTDDDGMGAQDLYFYGDSSRGFDEALMDWERPDSVTGTSYVVYIDGDARTAVLYHDDHPDPAQEGTYSKFIWSEPNTQGPAPVSDFQLYENAADIPLALAETATISADYNDPGETYVLGN